MPTETVDNQNEFDIRANHKNRVVIKFHLPKTKFEVGWRRFIEDGIHDHSQTQLVESHEEADFTIVGLYSNTKEEHLKQPQKLIVLDFTDRFRRIIDPNRCYLYFKRSLFHKPSRNMYNRDVLPIAFPIKKAFVKKSLESPPTERPIDISCFFNLSYPDTPWSENRARVARYLGESDLAKNFNLRVGEIGESGAAGRSSLQEAYWLAMQQSKIIVTCNPQPWEGDHRLFEALNSGALVFVDRMHTPMEYPLKHNEHLVYYDLNNLDSLCEQLTFYLEDRKKRIQIASQGAEYARQHHTYINRIDQVVSAIETKRAGRDPVALYWRNYKSHHTPSK